LRFEPNYANNYGELTLSLPQRATTTDLMRNLRELCNLGVTALVLVAYYNDRTILLELDQPLMQYVMPGKPLIVSLFLGIVFASITAPPQETPMGNLNHLQSASQMPSMVPISQMGVVPPVFSPLR
jgi:hypothetical protein